MIDISKLKYKTILITETALMLDISGAVTGLGWEEGDGELSARISFSLLNAKYQGSSIYNYAKLGCTVIILSNWGSNDEEVARGTLNDRDTTKNGSTKKLLDVTANDILYNLQQSKDNRFYPAGTGTKSAMLGVFSDWGVPVAVYNGPNIAHAKTVFRNEALGDILTALLKDASNKGAGKYTIRADKGSVSVLLRGSNTDIYYLEEDSNMTVASDKSSISDLVTRVKIVGKANDDEKSPVEAIVDGLTEFGIRQKIVTRSEDDTLSAAKAEAKQIIDEEGHPKRNIKLEGPDVPVMRKGDKVYVKTETINGYCYVLSIRHNADERTMSLEVEVA